MARIITWLLLAAIHSAYLSAAYKILVVFPFPSTSHGILGDGFVRILLKAGHEVTYITPFPKESLASRPNFQQVDVSQVKEAFPHILNIKAVMEKKVDLGNQNLIFHMTANITKKALANENVQKLLSDRLQVFDVVIAEWMFNEIYCGLAVVFNCPCIWFFPFEHYSGILSLIDEVPNPAYTQTIRSSYVTPFSFKQRLVSLWTQIETLFTKTFLHLKIEREIYETSLTPILTRKGRTLPTYDEMRHNISLVLVNSHVSLGTALRLPQNYVNIGGFHVDTDVQLQDLKIMDNAKNGVIYFSMGSNLKSKELPDELKRNLLIMFGRLKQTVLWKFEEVLPNLPSNVHILKWAPQTSILTHPNCVLFITHGGLLSTTETVHFGVPIIGIPVFADQFLNVDKAVAKGFAKRVDLTYSLDRDLESAIEDVLRDPRYQMRAKELSMIYHDRPASPGAELVHWVEHVVRTRGAPHLRSPALHVPWYQKAYLDLAALIVAVILIAKYAIKRLSFSNKKTIDQKKKK